METKDNEGRTRLWFAAYNGQTDVVRALVSAGADVNTQPNDGISALSVASYKGYIDAVNVLLDKGARIEARDKEGRTSLLFAVASGYTDVVRALVSARADVNALTNNGISALSLASEGGCLDIVNMLLDEGACIETKDNEGRTPLWFAGTRNEIDVIRTLVSAGADVNTQNNDGISVLSLASYVGCMDVVNTLLARGAHIEARDNEGCTPLWHAVENGHTDVVRALLSAGADVDTQNNDGISVLSVASEEGYIDIVTMLLAKCAYVKTRDNKDRTPLWFAAANGHINVVLALMSAGADVNTQRNDGMSALSFASQEGHLGIVEILLAKGAHIETIEKKGCTPLWFAAANGHINVVLALISAGADVNTQSRGGVSALSFASKKGYLGIVDILLVKDAHIETIEKEGRTPLWFAAASGHTSVVLALVSAGADVNTQSSGGVSALSFASHKGYLGIVDILLNKGAQTETTDNEGHTPLWFAAANGHTSVVRALLSAGADVNTQRNDGVSALSIASEGGYIDIVKMLLDEGARIEIRDNEGVTPLFMASRNGRTDVVRTFLENGAQIETRDSEGRTSLWVAAARGQTDVVRALVSAGADVNTQHNDAASVLGVASHKGYLGIVDILLDNDAQIETRDSEGRTSLWVAVARRQTDVVRALVSAGADVNTQHNDGVSALGIASQEGYVDVVNIFVNKGAQIEIRNNHARTPLFLAAGNGHTDVVRTFLDNGAQIETEDNEGRTPLWIAVAKGQTDIVRALVSAGADVNTRRNDGLSALCLASWTGYVDVVNLLLDSDARIACRDSEGRTPLWSAAAGGHVDIVSALQKHGAFMHDRNNDNIEPIDIASYNGHVDIVQIFTRCNSSAIALRYSNLYPSFNVHFDCNRQTALHLTSDLKAAMSLLDDGADVEAENVDGLRPIHCAVRRGLVELVELLIQHGANVNAADVFGNTPLHDAVCHGMDIVQSLVQHGSKVNIQNIDGKTPLHIAVDRQQSDVVVFLLNQDADVGLTDVWRNTPFHYFTCGLLAASEVAESVVKRLTKESHHLFIRNAVNVSMPIHIATYGTADNQCYEVNSATLSSKHATVADNLNSICEIKTDTDCNKNTPLHHAVGVYGQLKMFKISTDVIRTVEFLVKCGADINVQNNDGLTPLHVARGRKAIEACLQHGGDQTFTITDKRGRNFWHLLFLTGTQNKSELETSIKPMIAKSEAKYSVDDLNRTPLHYACMDRNPCIAIWNWLVMEFMKNFSVEHINKQDKFGRTALHYVAIGGDKELLDMLTKMKADNTIQDNYQKTGNEYVDIRDKFSTKMSLLRLTKSSYFIERHNSDISAIIPKYFADSSYTGKECIAKLDETLQGLTGFCDAASYVLNTWQGCRYEYEDITCVPIGALEHDDQQRFREQGDFVTNNDESATETTTVFAAIQSQVNKAMKVLAKEITEHDRHRFACDVISVGSVHEGTKIGCCDEFDYNFVLTNLSSICEVCYSPESPPGFVLLKASMPVVDEDLKDLFDEQGILNTRIVKFRFETLAKQVLSSASFCNLTDFEFIDPILHTYVGVTHGNTTEKLNTRILLTCTKPVNGHHVMHTISVDIVPALHIKDWWPDTARHKEFCEVGECLIVFTQPQSKYPWIGWTQSHGFTSFARAESRLLRDCHPVAKAAYMVVKRMSKYFCQYELFSSHTIKMALLWCLDKEDLSKYRSSTCSDEVNGSELLCLVQNVLRRLLFFAAQDYVPSYFLPKCHQPVWLKERYLKQYHMRLYQHGLTYKDLFSLNEQQSRDEVLQNIKTLFTFSHVMYWTVLSGTDELKLFVPPTINPLCEMCYDSDE